MPISHSHELVFVHIPKNAGTAITKAKNLNFVMEGHHKWFDYKNILGEKKWEKYYKFSVVRNPWDRLVSNYKYSRMLKSFWHSIDGTTPYPKHVDYDLCSNLNFDQCVKLLHKDPKRFKHMGWGLQFPYVCDNITKNIIVDEIFFHHELSSDRFMNVIPNLEKINVSDGSEISYKSFYTDELINIVGDIYKEDIKIFKMEYNNE